MKCKRCNSENISVQAVTETKTKGKGLTYWLFWVWFDMIIWIFAFLPRLIIGLLKGKKVKSKTYKVAICQDCGKSWRLIR